MFRVSSINIFFISPKRMDWVKYYQDQINKSTNNRLNKVEDFTGNQTGGFSFFAREFGTFIGKKNYAFRKWLNPKGIQALEEHIQSVKEKDEEKRKKLIEHIKKMAEIYAMAENLFNLFSVFGG